MIALNSDGTVAFFYHAEYLWALNLSSGDMLWNVPEENSSYEIAYIYYLLHDPANGMLYGTGTPEQIYVFDSAIGGLLDDISPGNMVTVSFRTIQSAC